MKGPFAFRICLWIYEKASVWTWDCCIVGFLALDLGLMNFGIQGHPEEGFQGNQGRHGWSAVDQ